MKIKKFGWWTVLDIPAKPYHSTVQCKCGLIKEVSHSNLKLKKSTKCYKCGVPRTHGKTNTAIYHVWESMKQRCLNKNNPNYYRYGGRGVDLCSQWYRFENFYKDMGDVPYGLTIERINNNKGYNKDNCKWATMKEQNLNKDIPKGDAHSLSILSSKDVVAIRGKYIPYKYSQYKLGLEFGVSRSCIQGVVENKRWKCF
jgi:hypothetical protein